MSTRESRYAPSDTSGTPGGTTGVFGNRCSVFGGSDEHIGEVGESSRTEKQGGGGSDGDVGRPEGSARTGAGRGHGEKRGAVTSEAVGLFLLYVVALGGVFFVFFLIGHWGAGWLFGHLSAGQNGVLVGLFCTLFVHMCVLYAMAQNLHQKYLWPVLGAVRAVSPFGVKGEIWTQRARREHRGYREKLERGEGRSVSQRYAEGAWRFAEESKGEVQTQVRPVRTLQITITLPSVRAVFAVQGAPAMTLA